MQHSLFVPGNVEHYYPMMRIVQATFSLWRSLFLTAADFEPDVICKDAQNMLETVLESNAYTFPNDLRDKTFTASYYNTNARYRIERLCRDDSFAKLPSVINLRRVQVDDCEMERDQMTMWQLCFEALRDCLGQFEERLLSNSPS